MVPTPGWTFRHDRQTRTVLGIWVGLTLFAGATWALAHGLEAVDLQLSWPWPMLVASAVGVSGALYAATSVPSDEWRVHWRPDRWSLAGMPEPGVESGGRLHPMIDLGSWMLLRFQQDQGGGVRWFAVRPATIDGDWHGLRAALFWPRSEAPGPGVDPARTDGR
jgi:hypothetical protein